jgi:hypothetical protein
MRENSFEIHVGRLVEIRVYGYESAADVQAMMELASRRKTALPPGTLAVTVADWRQCALLSPGTAEEVSRMFLGANAGTLRSALLYSDHSPTAVMQFLRLIRDAKNENRRMFSDPRQLAAWLGEVLTPSETYRLRAFLGIQSPSTRPPPR